MVVEVEEVPLSALADQEVSAQREVDEASRVVKQVEVLSDEHSGHRSADLTAADAGSGQKGAGGLDED